MDQKTRKYKRSQVRKKLEDERHKMIDEAMKSIHIFQPPFDYKRPTKTQEKVYIPAREFLKINFMGQLIGPQGNTLKKIIQKTGARITIRGFGSVKEGKYRNDSKSDASQEEELHCSVAADMIQRKR